jgi:hypothetical protein
LFSLIEGQGWRIGGIYSHANLADVTDTGGIYTDACIIISHANLADSANTGGIYTDACINVYAMFQ